MGPTTAGLLVVASMIGTGVFTTTGYLVRDVGSAGAILLMWALGGVSAFCGAVAYAELAAALPNNGGEYQLLGRIYHPAVGFAAGVATVFVGFAAPIAATAIAFGDHVAAVFPGVPSAAAGLGLVAATAVLHALRVSVGGGVQNVVTAVKVLIIAAFAIVGLLTSGVGHLADPQRAGVLAATGSAAFASGLVYVSYAYSGWNAAVYVAGEVRDPNRNLPLALLGGTAVVTGLYVALNAMFLAAAPASALSGVVEVADRAAAALFSDTARRVLSATIALGLASTCGAFVMTGARILEGMGRDHPGLAVFAARRPDAGPVVAIATLAVLATGFVVTATYDALVTYAGVVLAMSDALTVLGVFVLRRREPGLPRPYRTWGYPVAPLVHLALAAWMIAFALWASPLVALASAATIAVGLLAWLPFRR